MEYTFVQYNWDGTKVFGIETTDIENLRNFGSWDWTPNKIQQIIDGVEKNKTLAKDKDPYVWGNEDVTVFANEIGVLLIDKMTIRAKQEVEPLELTHEELLTFLQDFKKFVEENQ